MDAEALGIWTGNFTRMFAPGRHDAQALALLGPASISEVASRKPTERQCGAWKLLFGAMALRAAGLASEANDWLNHAGQVKPAGDVFRAEFLSEAAHGLRLADRLADAASSFDSACAVWRDATEQSFEAGRSGDEAATAAFAKQLLPMAAAAQVALPKRSQRDWLWQWLTEHALMRRSQVVFEFATLLLRAGRPEEARTLVVALERWIDERFVRMAPAPFGPERLERSMERGVRSGLYSLGLAMGEIELATGAFQTSADAFARAAALYESHAVDASDSMRLLQAKFNQANSLLRLKRYPEALDIYRLVELGFNHFGTDAMRQRVQHALLFARMKMEEDGDA